jgi:hypothetical protein
MGIAAAIASAMFALSLGAASAATTAIDGVNLPGGGTSLWDPANPASDTQCEDIPAGFAAVDDGSLAGNTDAFDGGFVLSVDGTPFVDGDGDGDKVQRTLAAGPATVEGLAITAQIRTFKTSAALRYLVTLKNVGASQVTKEVELGSGLGSDAGTVIEASSDLNKTLDAADTWVVTSDGAPFDDPLVGQVFSGKGATVDISNVIAAPETPDAEDCSMVDFPLTLNPGQSQQLMFFATMSPTSGGAAAAQQGMTKFASQKKLERGGLLDGIDPRKYKRIVNWRLVRPRR